MFFVLIALIFFNPSSRDSELLASWIVVYPSKDVSFDSSLSLSTAADDRMVLLVCPLHTPLIAIGFGGDSIFASFSSDALLLIVAPLALSPFDNL